MTGDHWERIQKLFAAALELPPGERAAYVHEEAEDAALRAEVLSLLEAHESRGRLDSVADRLAALSAAVPVADLTAALSGRYRIERELGRGGMATVYLAHDQKHARPVALKVLRRELAAALGPERFLREIQIAARLTHPNILPLHDSGEAAGCLYYVMPYVEGESLRTRLAREKQLPLADALQIAREVADALNYAHSHDVVHRDIKPENILFQAGHAVVSDFGIARAITAAGGDKLTETGIAVGTPAYMSPEQASGETRLDGRSDIYSLGCVLYEMLAGEPPFTGPSAQAVLARHSVDPVPPLHTVRPTVPDAVERALTKALAKVPVDRFAGAAQFADALTAESAAPSALRGRRPRLAERRWLVVPLIMAALIAVGAVAWFARGLFQEARARASARPMLVVLPFENLGPPSDEYFADGITQEITSRLAQLSGLGVIARTSAIQYKETKKTVREIGEELGVQYVLEGSVRWEKTPGGSSRVRVSPQLVRVSDATHVWGEPYEAALSEIFRLQADVAERVTQALSVTLLAPEREALGAKPTTNLEAYDYYLRGKDYSTRRFVEEDARLAVQMYERAVTLDPNFALAYTALAQSYLSLSWDHGHTGETPKAQAALERARQLAPDLADTHLALGYYLYWGNRDYAGALEQFALAEDRQPNNAEAIAAKSYVEKRLGQWEQHLADLTRALELSPRSHDMFANLGISYTVLRRYAEAERAYDRAISLAPDIPAYYSGKVEVYLLWDGSTRRARQVLEQAARTVDPAQVLLGQAFRGLLMRLFGAELAEPIAQLSLRTPGIDTLDYFLAKAELYATTKRPALARAYFDSARVVLEAYLATYAGVASSSIGGGVKALARAPTPTAVIFRHPFLALAYAGLGQKELAIRTARKGVQLLPVSEDAIIGPELRGLLAEVYVKTGEYDAALDELEFLLSIPSWLSVPVLRLDPIWEPLRDHPRFRRLLERP